MNLFRDDLSKLTVEDLEAFCAEQHRESTILEYKLDASKAIVVKSASALANTQGGLVIFGVKAPDPDRVPDLPIQGMTRPDPKFVSRVESWCIDSITPPLVVQAGYVEASPTKSFGVIHVEPSDLAHTIDGGTKLYVRHGDKSDPQEATEEERELLRNRREPARRIDRELAEDLARRVMVDVHPQYPSMLFRILPRYSHEEAIPRSQLFELGRPMSSIPVHGRIVERLQSYSHGVIGSFIDGRDDHGESLYWQLALTSRGALGFSRSIRRGVDNPRTPMRALWLLALAQKMAESARRLCTTAGFWGTYDVLVEAKGWKTTPILEFDPVFPERFLCQDDDISIALEWSANELRSEPYPFVAELFRALWWGFGRGAEEQTDKIINFGLKKLPPSLYS